MTTGNQSNRYSNFGLPNGMPNGRDSTDPSEYSSSNWNVDASVWGLPISNHHGKRETLGSRGSDGAFPNTTSGTSALADSLEGGMWSRQWPPDGQPTPSAAGTASPNRTGGMSQAYPMPKPTYYTAPRPGTIGRSRLEPSASALHAAQRNSATLEIEYQSYAQQRSLNKQGSQEVSSLEDVNGSSMSDHQSLDQRQNVFNGAGPSLSSLQAQNANFGHAHRPSIHSASTTIASQMANQQAYDMNTRLDADDLIENFDRAVTLGGGTDRRNSGIGNANGYMPAAQPFQFNPVSQPWDASMEGAAKPNSPGYAHSPYSDSLAGRYNSSKRASLVDRGTSPTSSFRQAHSPNHYGTPPVPGDRFSRPGSRDPRALADLEPQVNTQTFLQQHYGHAMYNPAYAPQFPAPPLYEQGHQVYLPRGQLAYSLGGNISPFIPGGGIHGRSAVNPNMSTNSRSSLLAEYKLHRDKLKRSELREIVGHVAAFCGDQYGSRFIQSKLETAKSADKEAVFNEMLPDVRALMSDVFGNYVVQKFFEHGDQRQKSALANSMEGMVVSLSKQTYACRVVQKALEHVLVAEQVKLVKELEPEVLDLVRDQNGNHVIQKVIERVPRMHTGFIMMALRTKVGELAEHQYGCRVLQRMLEKGTSEEKASIMLELDECASKLITNQYGNYVAQHVIEKGRPQDRSKFIKAVTQHLVCHSKHKFASNVVEKCIHYGTPEERQEIRKQLSGSRELPQLIKDQYCNYVIQKLLRMLEGSEWDAFASDLRPHLPALLKQPGPTRQVEAIENLLKDPTWGNGPSSPTLQVDINSTVPTPVLTMEPNTPQSSSPPSTDASAAGEIDECDRTEKPTPEPASTFPVVQVDEA